MDSLFPIFKSIGLDATVFEHAAIFIVVYLFMYFLLLKPYFAAFVERKKQTEGSEELADQVVEQAQELELVYQQKARAFSNDYKAIYDKSRTEAIHEYDRLVAEARNKARDTIEGAKTEIGKQVKAVEAQLVNEAPSVSEAIVGKLTGKELAQ